MLIASAVQRIKGVLNKMWYINSIILFITDFWKEILIYLLSSSFILCVFSVCPLLPWTFTCIGRAKRPYGKIGRLLLTASFALICHLPAPHPVDPSTSN